MGKYTEEFVEYPHQTQTVYAAVISAAHRVKNVGVHEKTQVEDNENGTKIMLLAGYGPTPINVKLLPGSSATSTYVKFDTRYNAKAMAAVINETTDVLSRLSQPVKPSQATPATVSPDGKYLWDGSQWKPIGGQVMDEIRKLTDLREHGHISQREYDDKKAELLARL
jgi:hypothetical protein